MKTIYRITLVVLMSFAVLLAACGGRASKEQNSALTGYAALVERLEANGVAVEAAGDVEIVQPFFTPKGKIITVNGRDIQVFEYASEAEAEAEAATVASDGRSTTTTMITWMDTPHFFKSGRVIAIYVGSSAEVLQALEGAFGPSFAGG